MFKLPSIPEFYRDKNILITGGSGFIGKVLIEKLLRSCPGLKNIYLLVREKKGKSPEDRIRMITDLPLFDILKEQQPEALKKIKVVTGDVRELGLGLNPESKKFLTEEINIVFHGAASVRFDDPLTDAVILNVRGTREVINLALSMKKLDVLIHISTTYCNTDKSVIKEELYPEHADWRKTIEIAENIDRHTLDVLTSKYIGVLPNTYTFTKSLAEHVVHNLCNGKIPVVIFRPSIVISTLDEPVQGWIDNFNGPVGLLLASGKGIIRTLYSDPNVISDYVPVDLVAKALIISSWKQATEKDSDVRLAPCFYNGSNNGIQPITVGEIVEMGQTIRSEVPLNDVLWYPNVDVIKCYYYYFIKMLLLQLLPAMVIDMLLKIFRKKPLLMKIQRRIYTANMALAYYSLNQWQFINDKAVNLENHLLPCDVEDFSFKANNVEPLQYFINCTIGARKYLLKEGTNLEAAKRHSSRMWILSKIINFLWYLGIVWIILIKFNILSVLINKCKEFYVYLTEA